MLRIVFAPTTASRCPIPWLWSPQLPPSGKYHRFCQLPPNGQFHGFGPQQLLPCGQFHGFLMANSVWSQTATRCKFHAIGPPQLLSGGQFHAPTTASCVPISWIWPPNLSFGQKFYGLSPHSLYYLQLQF